MQSGAFAGSGLNRQLQQMGRHWDDGFAHQPVDQNERPALAGPSLVAGAGFEPATFGLCEASKPFGELMLSDVRRAEMS